MSLWVYCTLFFILQPVIALYLLKRAVRQPDYMRGWAQRFFASVPVCPRVDGARQRIWVHAVSVGEAHAISPLVAQWASIHPDHEWLISCTTPTGRETCERLYGHLNGVRIFYLPYDLPYLVSRCLRRVNANALWVVETEIWPNLFLKARDAGVQTALINARVSPRTGERLLKLGLIAAPVLQSVNKVLCQTAEDAAVFERLGCSAHAITGNLKFDVALKPQLATLGRTWKGELQCAQVLVLASSREGEEALFLDVLNRTQFFKRMPKAAVWIVPRHPQRFDEVFDLMSAFATRMGVARPIRRSGLFDPDGRLLSPSVASRSARLVLGDSMGEMPAYFSAADLAFLGGSWLPFGGQNLIEACAYGCPVWLGPHTFNFAKAAEDALRIGAAKRFDSIQSACEHFMAGDTDIEQARKSAFSYARSHRGATQRSIDALLGRHGVQGLRAD